MVDGSARSASTEGSCSNNAFDVQAHLRSERDQIAFLNAVLSEGRPELLVGAIWDVTRAIDAAAKQAFERPAHDEVRQKASDDGRTGADGNLKPDQIIAGRNLLGWSAARLAKRCDLSVRTVMATELDRPRSARSVKALDRIRTALEAAGVEFTNGGQPGVRMRAG